MSNEIYNKKSKSSKEQYAAFEKKSNAISYYIEQMKNGKSVKCNFNWRNLFNKKKTYSKEEYDELLAAYQDLLTMYNRLVVKRASELAILKSTVQSINRSFNELDSIIDKVSVNDVVDIAIAKGTNDEEYVDTVKLAIKLSSFKALLQTQESIIDKFIDSNINKVNDKKVEE